MPAQTGSGMSMHGSPWDGAEGPQNTHTAQAFDYASPADMPADAEYAFKMEPGSALSQVLLQTPQWTAGLSTPDAIIGSVAMRRSVSRSSAGSYHSHAHSVRAAHKASRPRILSSQSSHSSHSAHSAASAANTLPASYAMAYADGIPAYFSAPPYFSYAHNMTSASMSPSAYSYGMASSAMGAAYAPPHQQQQQQQQPAFPYTHIDPACTQVSLDFDTSAPPSVSSHAWNSDGNSRHSSPEAADDDSCQWPALASSPAESSGSTSSYLPHMDTDQGSSHSSASSHSSHSGSDSGRRLSHGADDEYELSAATTALQQKRSHSESSDSARDHYLYKNVACGGDGLYHCPWEGKNQCSHKPEKLKCNYDKFVDSHLKPYRCKHTSCENARFSSTACLLRHEREAHAMHGHGDKPYLCPYASCDRAQPGFGFPRQWNLKDHMRRVHRDDGTQTQAQAQAQAPHMAMVSSSALDTLPVSSSAAAAVSKNRKRKKDAPASASSSRKSSSASRGSASSRAAIAEAQAAQAAQIAQIAQAQAQAQAQAAEAYAEAEKARLQMEQWTLYRTSLLDLVSAGLESPNDPKIQSQLQLIQEQVDHLNQIAAACFMTQETASASYMHFAQT